jgi:hypothetical protein
MRNVAISAAYKVLVEMLRQEQRRPLHDSGGELEQPATDRPYYG